MEMTADNIFSVAPGEGVKSQLVLSQMSTLRKCAIQPSTQVAGLV